MNLLLETVKFFVFVLFAFYCIGIIRVILIKRKIKRIHKKMNEEIDNQKKIFALLLVKEGRIGIIKEKYRLPLEELERKRRFILDKLPLFKK